MTVIQTEEAKMIMKRFREKYGYEISVAIAVGGMGVCLLLLMLAIYQSAK
jgi:hypothetical protein